MSIRISHSQAAALGIGAYLLDQFTKFWFLTHPTCSPGMASPIAFCLYLNKGSYMNPAGRVGMFEILPVEIGLTVLTMFSLFIWQRFFHYNDSFTRVGLWILIAGIAGNLTDRVSRGSVVDGIAISLSNRTTVFNLADVWISGAVLIIGGTLVYLLFIQRTPDQRKLFVLKTPHKVITAFMGTMTFVSLGAVVLAFAANGENGHRFTFKEIFLLGGFVLLCTMLMALSTLFFIQTTLGPLERLLKYVAAEEHSKRPFKFRSNDLLDYLNADLEKILNPSSKPVRRRKRRPTLGRLT